MAAAIDAFVLHIAIDEETADRLEHRSELLGMSVSQYVTFVLHVAEQMPDSLLFCLDAGVPVTFEATAELGLCDVD